MKQKHVGFLTPLAKLDKLSVGFLTPLSCVGFLTPLGSVGFLIPFEQCRLSYTFQQCRLSYTFQQCRLFYYAPRPCHNIWTNKVYQLKNYFVFPICICNPIKTLEVWSAYVSVLKQSKKRTDTAAKRVRVSRGYLLTVNKNQYSPKELG